MITLSRDALGSVTGGQSSTPLAREQGGPQDVPHEMPVTEDKSWVRQAGEFARDASGGFVTGALGLGSDNQLWGKYNRVSREFGSYGEFLTLRGGRRAPH